MTYAFFLLNLATLVFERKKEMWSIPYTKMTVTDRTNPHTYQRHAERGSDHDLPGLGAPGDEARRAVTNVSGYMF